MAVGIMGFSFVAILGLVPVALTSFRDTKTGAASSLIAQQIVSEVQTTAFNSLTSATGNPYAVTVTNSQNVSSTAICLPAPLDPTATNLYVRYFDEQGDEVPYNAATANPANGATANPAPWVYQANIRVLVGPPFVQAGTATTGTSNADVANVTIQVAYNPGRLPLDPPNALAMSQNNDLWTGTANGGKVTVPILSFQTNVARNFQ